MTDSRWKCPDCGSLNVQIALPTWYRETMDGELEMIDTDTEADPLWWHCEDCGEGRLGDPDEVE